jgi:hypothetical protein
MSRISTARTRRRRRGAAMTVVAAAGAVLVAGAAAASSGRDTQPAPPQAAVELQREVDAMRTAGLPPDDPKVEMLEAEVDALIAGTSAEAVPDAGMDAPANRSGDASLSSTPQEAVQAAGEVDSDRSADPGAVECEPVPQALDAAEVADASCLSVPQPDGTTRYVAVRPTGVVHVVRFASGQVERLADRQLPPEAGSEPRLVPDEAGDVRVMSGGAEVATIDVG